MARLAEKIAIVTGGAGGIGLATSTLFVQEGAKVLLVDLDEQALQEAVAAIGGDAVSYAVADVTQPEQVQNYTRTAVERYGGIDVFINNAGIGGEFKPITDYTIETFDRVMAVNVRGVWLGLKYVIPEMQKRGGGSIVITSSIAGVGGGPGFSAYVASKHAVIGIMRSAAAECAPMGIRVNTVNPGFTETRMMHSLEEQISPGEAEEGKRDFLQRVPLKRYATPQEIAQPMLFLASDESSYCTGSVYMVDGGVTKRR
ncbi:MAG: SDR family oxidoreductase [Desulfobacterales bacterium]|jgi:NAD(P)-dependent dehydrogenase (short-subunit alcohol dehydrogenase family)